MRFLRLTISYDGTNYSGWQWQPERLTVQGVLESAIQRVTGEQMRAVSSGRTDAGVHALGQAVSIATGSRLDCETLGRALNANLPRDVLVRQICPAPDGFNAITHARSKRYRYVIHDDPLPDVFSRDYAWQVRQRLDETAMHEAALTLCGKRDFKSYETSGSKRVSTVRTVHDMVVQRRADAGQAGVIVEVEADGFLYNMVRNLVGTLVEVGRGKQAVAWPAEVLAARDRRLAGATAPAHGLYLLRVRYDF